MKKIIATILMTAMAAGAAQAQTGHAPAPGQSQSAQHQHMADQHDNGPQKSKASSSRYPAPPKHWGKKSQQDWQRHVDRCRAKYRSYDPRTDRFAPRKGQSVICRL